MEKYAFQGKSHPGGAIPKSNSKFYTPSELTFEDDFNPTSMQNKTIEVSTESSNITDEGSDNQLKNSSKISSKEAMNKNCNEKSCSIESSCASPLMTYVIRLKRGEELRKSLISFVKKHELKAAFIMTCVGSATSARLRVASATAENEATYMLDIMHPTEIVSLVGTVSDGGHLHAALADSTGKMVGGHLLELTVDTTAEIVLGDCSSLSFNRVFDENTGFHELSVDKR